MKVFLIVFVFFAAPLAVADDYCKRPNEVDLEAPAGLSGDYEIIGRLPDSDMAYSGHLEIKEDNASYTLKRTVSANSIQGEAWIELCSPDKFMVLKFKYTTTLKPFSGNCYLRGNGDNYYLISCYTYFDETKHRQHGLESMFQLQAP